MSALADALEAYEMGVALGAHSLVQAELFADLRAAHVTRMTELHEAEEAVQRVWGQLLPCLDAPEYGPDECDGSGRCAASVHVHGCFSDVGRCDEPSEHGVYA